MNECTLGPLCVVDSQIMAKVLNFRHILHLGLRQNSWVCRTRRGAHGEGTALRADADFHWGSAPPAASPRPLPATHICPRVLSAEIQALGLALRWARMPCPKG